MATYPFIIIPDKIIDVKKNIKKLLIKKFEKKYKELPNAPKQPIKVEFTFAYIIFSALFIGASVYILTKDSSIANPAFIAGLFVYPIIYLIQCSNYDALKNIYDQDLQSFQKKQQEINALNEQIKFDNQKLEQNLTNIHWANIEGQKIINEHLPPIKSAEIQFPNPQVGKSELCFFNYLNKYFPASIFRNKVIEIFYNNYYEEEKAYSPDFIFVHQKTNLTIDIEIDEPYNKDYFPIHTLNNKHDQKRNEYFSKLNWVILRFSERQIIMTPESCCFEIAKLIYDITGDHTIMSQFDKSLGITKDYIWTHEKALDMAKVNIRSNYKRLEEKFLHFDETIIFDKWECNNFIYTFVNDFTVFENPLNSNEITDNGHFEFDKYDNTKISIYWRDGPTNYKLTQMDTKNFLFIELPNRNQFIFKKTW